MSISIGDQLPEATLLSSNTDDVAEVSTQAMTKGRKVVLFAVPGAYTPTCSSAHVPSFMRVAADLKAKGVDEIACISVNDPFVLKAWGESTGAIAAGINMYADAAGELSQALGLTFDAPARGLLNRSLRYSMLVEDGKVTQLNVEESPGVCELSAGETLLEQL